MNITLTFAEPGYIAHPYTIERHKLIEIQKLSGMMRSRSERKKREALEAHLRMNGLTMEDYLALEKKADEPFHYDKKGNIIIPASSVKAMLVNANAEAPSRMRIANIRIALKVSDFVTDKKEPDGVWERFAVVRLGTGQKASNQRGLRSNAYIKDFAARGKIECDEQMVKPEVILDLLRFAGRNTGIGASRGMGYGRFTVEASG